MQLEFNLDNKTELDIKFDNMNIRIDSFKSSNDKVRRGLFARHGELSKAVADILERVNELEEEVARLKRNVSDKQIEWRYMSDGNLFSLAVS